MARTLRLKSYAGIVTSAKLRVRGSNTVTETIALAHQGDGIYTGTITAGAANYDLFVFADTVLVEHFTITIATTDPLVYEPDNLNDIQLDLNNLSAGTGTGARSVTILVQNSSLTPIQGATVRLTESGNTYVATTLLTGIAQFSLNDATYQVSITKAGYSFTPVNLVVDGTENQTYTLTTLSVPPPSAPNLSVGTLLCLSPLGVAEKDVVCSFRMVQGPGSAGYSYDSQTFTQISDINGNIQAEFVIGAQYAVRRGTGDTCGKETLFVVPNAVSFNIGEHLGQP